MFPIKIFITILCTVLNSTLIRHMHTTYKAYGQPGTFYTFCSPTNQLWLHKVLSASQSRVAVSDQATPLKMHVIVASVDDWRRGLDNNHLVGVVLVDLSKAFDSIHHDLLLSKMDRYGIRCKEQRWFHSYLNGRKQRVVIDGELRIFLENC